MPATTPTFRRCAAFIEALRKKQIMSVALTDEPAPDFERGSDPTRSQSQQ